MDEAKKIEAEKKPESEKDKTDKKIKNLISAVILLAGLFAGSLFVDIAQLVRGTGFSEKNLSKGEIFEAAGKTWVAYNEPTVDVKVITDESCAEACDPAEALVWMRRVMPTVSAQKISYNSDQAKTLIEKFGIKTLPAFVFSNAVSRTDFFAQAQIIFEQKESQYMLKTDELGLTPGKYLSAPEIKDGEATFGKKDSAVKVIVYSDFQCPYCKIFWATLRGAMKQYGDRVLFGYKELPLPIHSQAGPAALAAQCALEQDKFWEYGDKLFASQEEWSSLTDVQKFKDYAKALVLNVDQFNQCLDGKKYQSNIDDSASEADNFGVSGTPAIFINNQFKNGVTSADDFSAAIEAELGR